MRKSILLSCAVLFSASVFAHEGKVHEDESGTAKRAACKADVDNFCKDVKPGEGRIMECLKVHESELSAGCKAQSGKHNHAKWAVCKADIDSFCKDIEPGEGRIVECLKAHESELSADCKAQCGARKHAKWEAACAKDKETLCKDVKPGGGRIAQCLKENAKDLSEDCRSIFKQEKKRMMSDKHKDAHRHAKDTAKP